MPLWNSFLSPLRASCSQASILRFIIVMCISGPSTLSLSNIPLMDIWIVSGLAITHNTAMHIHVQAFGWTYISSSLVEIPRGEISVCFTF